MFLAATFPCSFANARGAYMRTMVRVNQTWCVYANVVRMNEPVTLHTSTGDMLHVVDRFLGRISLCCMQTPSPSGATMVDVDYHICSVHTIPVKDEMFNFFFHRNFVRSSFPIACCGTRHHCANSVWEDSKANLPLSTCSTVSCVGLPP